MLDVSWRKIDNYKRRNLDSGAHIQISGILDKDLDVSDPVPEKIPEFMQRLDKVVQESFLGYSVKGVQSPLEANPQHPEARYISLIDIDKGTFFHKENYGYIACIYGQRKKKDEDGLLQLMPGVCKFNMVLPSDESDASKKVIEAAWPGISELDFFASSEDFSTIVKVRGMEILKMGYKVLEEMGLDLPKNQVYLPDSF
jgi:hypothetical protein